jgi:hypothetical protein
MNNLAYGTEVVVLAAQIADAVGFSFADGTSPDESEHLNPDGAWEYHFETDPAWGFLAATDRPVTTLYPGWGPITLEPYHWYIFHEGDLIESVSPRGSNRRTKTVTAVTDQDDREAMMREAFRTERDAQRTEQRQ